ncbi:CRISPR-associated protein Cas5, partial [Lactobacillus helveticus]
MKTATIRLTAPLQSYGNQASFNQRTSDNYPSKSAVIGIIAAALGYRR